jgi:hypothetical protein
MSGVSMACEEGGLGDEALDEALKLMESALDLLDLAGAPAQIGARLDLAICELRSATADRPFDRPAEALPRIRR